MLSLFAHKFHGPKGVGALYVKEEYSLNLILMVECRKGKKSGDRIRYYYEKSVK